MVREHVISYHATPYRTVSQCYYLLPWLILTLRCSTLPYPTLLTLTYTFRAVSNQRQERPGQPNHDHLLSRTTTCYHVPLSCQHATPHNAMPNRSTMLSSRCLIPTLLSPPLPNPSPPLPSPPMPSSIHVTVSKQRRERPGQFSHDHLLPHTTTTYNHLTDEVESRLGR